MVNLYFIGFVWILKFLILVGWVIMWCEGVCCCYEFVGVVMVIYRFYDIVLFVL